MRLIMHIGTHKTGSSALQVCLRDNASVLARNGIYYARMPRSKTSNSLARAVAKGLRAEAEAKIAEYLEQAHRSGAETLLVSAESFFAMTLFFKRFNGERVSDYWQSEHEAVERVGSMLPSGVSATVVAFFRRQDCFLESLYRQMVKARSVVMPINDFKGFVAEALDYSRHMEIWNSVFPDCEVYSYEHTGNNVTGFFFRNVLRIPHAEEFEGLQSRVNERLCRDILEYKRLLNGTSKSPVDRHMADIVCTEIGRSLPDDGRFQDYLSPKERTALLGEVEEGNRRLGTVYGIAPFPPLSPECLDRWEPYPGLSEERMREFAKRHAQMRKSPNYQLERAGLHVRRFILGRALILSWIIPFGRALLPRHRRPR